MRGNQPEVKAVPIYGGTHPGNIAEGLREIAARSSSRDAEALRAYADDVERLGRSAGVKFLGD